MKGIFHYHINSPSYIFLGDKFQQWFQTLLGCQDAKIIYRDLLAFKARGMYAIDFAYQKGEKEKFKQPTSIKLFNELYKHVESHIDIQNPNF